MEKTNEINICDSCLYNEVCKTKNTNDENGNNIMTCNEYKPTEDKPIIEDTEDFFPNRFLTSKERALLVAKIIKYTATSISNTLPVEDRLNSKLADSNIIVRFLTNCPESLVNELFLQIGANIRILLTQNPVSLGLEKEKPINIIH